MIPPLREAQAAQFNFELRALNVALVSQILGAGHHLVHVGLELLEIFHHLGSRKDGQDNHHPRPPFRRVFKQGFERNKQGSGGFFQFSSNFLGLVFLIV